jgi:hypothetical protein
MTWRGGGFLAPVLALACGSATEPSGAGVVHLVGTVDTIHFEVPVVAQPCVEGRGVLVTGAREGQGLLVLIRAAGAALDTGSYPLLTRADSATVRGVIVAVRYVDGPASHGFTVDDGVATVTQVSPSLSVQVRGRGVEGGVGGPRSAELTLDQVLLAPDSVSCRVQP